MTLKELIMKYDFDSIMPGLEMRDDQINGRFAGYKEAFDILRLMEPDNEFHPEDTPHIEIRWQDSILDDGERWIDVYGASCKWENVLAKDIKVANDLDLTETEVLARILWEMTFYGFTPKQREEVFAGWEPRKEPHNQYEKALWALQLRMYKNEVRKKDRWFDESGKGCYNMDYMKSMFNKPCLNRAKRKRKYRQELREEHLERMAKHDNLIQQLTKDSSLKRQNVDFLMNVENVHKVNFQSHIVNREERIPYLIQLITDYYNWDWVDGTDMICLLRTSITAPLTDQEKERISKFFSNFSHLGLHHAEGTDEELGNDVSLTVIVAK
jgi:hypothetical protein